MVRLSYRERRYWLDKRLANIRILEPTAESLRANLEPSYTALFRKKPWEIEFLLGLRGHFNAVELAGDAVPPWITLVFDSERGPMSMKLMRFITAWNGLSLVVDYPRGGSTALAEHADLLVTLADATEPIRIHQKRRRRW